MTPHYRFELLAPSRIEDRCSFDRFCCLPAKYMTYLKQLQILRGTAYLEDGAIGHSDLDEGGRFHMASDEESWHLLLVENELDNVIGCARYLLHSNMVRFDELCISRTVLAIDLAAGPSIRRMIEADIQRARRDGLGYVEVGGWAVMKQWRRTRAALDILAGSYALGELWGGCLGICTATFRHGSASIIRRFSGSTSEAEDGPFSAYYDPRYECAMELLRFNSHPARRYAAFINPIKRKLLDSVPLLRGPIQQTATSCVVPLVA